MVIDYNKNKQGIDISDQLSSYHTCLRKTVRWYHKVIIEFILGTSIVNAMILYNEEMRKLCKSTVSVTQFRELVCNSLLFSNSSTPDAQTENHYLRETNQMEGGKRSDRRIRRYCVGCYDRMAHADGRDNAKLKAKRVITECIACAGNPRFCLQCFPRYHSCKLKKASDK